MSIKYISHKDAPEEVCIGKGNILPGLVLYYPHCHENEGAGSLREAKLLKEGEDETIHVVERR